MIKLGINMGLRSIPPRTPMRDKYPVGGMSNDIVKPRQNYTYKKPIKPKIKPSIEVKQKSDITLDVFEEQDGKIRIIGELPGLEEEDLIVQIDDNFVHIRSGPNAVRNYQITQQLPDYFDVNINDKKVRNGIMTLVLAKTDYENVPELEEIFKKCLEKFPELESRDIVLRVVKSRRKARADSLDAAKVKIKGKDGVLIFVPSALWGKWDVFRPIIYHELSYYVDLKNPDKIFYERADKKSIALWKKLQEVGAMKCMVEGKIK